MFRTRIAALAASALTGCAMSGGMGTMDGIMSSWQGATVDDVIRQWGYPHEERNIAGRKILVWHRNVQWTAPATASTTGSANRIGSTTYYQGTTTISGGGTSNWACIRMLEVGASNTVVGWQWEGNNCPFAELGTYSTWRRK